MLHANLEQLSLPYSLMPPGAAPGGIALLKGGRYTNELQKMSLLEGRVQVVPYLQGTPLLHQAVRE